MSKRDFKELYHAQQAKGKLLCVGLDSDFAEIPLCARRSTVEDTIYSFNNGVIEVTEPVAGTYKLNRAPYERLGRSGQVALEATINRILELPSRPVVILDSKDGDTENTNRAYADSAFVRLNADAVTVNPYPGGRALQPFLERDDKGIFVVCRMSGDGSEEYQERITAITDEEAEKWGLAKGTMMPFYQLVAYRVSREWNTRGNCGLVVGATSPKQLALVRAIVGDLPILAPGGVTQGGDLMDLVVPQNLDSKGRGLIVSLSRSIIFASKRDDFARAAGAAATATHNLINTLI